MCRMKDIFKLFGELTDKTKFDQYLETLLIYLGSNIKDVTPEKLQDAVNEVLVEGGAMMSTVFQQVLQKGEEKKSLRVALNCLKKGMDIQTIAEITDLPIERIELLKTAFQMENAVHQ
jgi:predicted transposase YdaD